MQIEVLSNAELHVDFVDRFTSKIGAALGLAKPRVRPQTLNEVLNLSIYLGLTEFPSIETGTLPESFAADAGYQEKVFSMLQAALGAETVVNAQSCKESYVDDERNRRVKKVQIDGYVLSGVVTNVSLQEVKSQHDGGQLTWWVIDINAPCLSEEGLREKTILVRDHLVAYFQSISEEMNEEVKARERSNAYRYMLTDGN